MIDLFKKNYVIIQIYIDEKDHKNTYLKSSICTIILFWYCNESNQVSKELSMGNA